MPIRGWRGVCGRTSSALRWELREVSPSLSLHESGGASTEENPETCPTAMRLFARMVSGVWGGHRKGLYQYEKRGTMDWPNVEP